ncbi:LOW QUALITY PROTEIN: hypothetical protein HID58_006825 [Brassica napus]|uniref:Uncharacterized protein n=1 Tax=Brassica napus TaxID=3708 RepID=A0ABQ8ECG1_BRANA|nr:LOW QUALITY PROTEIN: hypothetical protein HID58_006825 [Brassica napus]
MFQQRQMQDLKRKSTEELKAFVEISCTTSPNHLVSVRKAYCLLLNSSLAEYTGSEEAQLHKYDGIFGFTKETIKRKGDEDTRRHVEVKERTFDKSVSFVSQPKGSDCCSIFILLNTHCISSKCMQSIVHGVMPDDIARLLNRACYYSAVRFMAYIHREYKKTSLSYQRGGGIYHLITSYLVAANTNMEVLLEVVEAEAKLVVAKTIKVSTFLCLGAAGARSIVAQTCALIFFVIQWLQEVAGGTTEHLTDSELRMFVDVCGEEYSSRQLQSNNVYPH